MTELDAHRLHLDLAAAWVRGRRPDLAADGPDDATLVARGRAAGLRVHRFKRTALPRVRRVVGALRALAPAELLDVGSGRGTGLWPLLEALPGVPVLAVDLDPRRVADLQALAAGGEARLRAVVGDVEALDLEDGAVDGATALEVLEHVERPERAARELLRVARRFVVATVPSQPDDNPEHRRLFTAEALAELLRGAGARRVTVDHVLDHRVAVALR